MTKRGFIQGMGLGLAAGAAVGLAMLPKSRKRSIKRAAGKAIQTVEDAAGRLSDAME